MHGIKRGAFANLIADDPEVESVFKDDVFADSSDEAVVLAGGIERHGEDALGWIIAEANARKIGVNGTSLIRGHGLLENSSDGDGMRTIDWYADTGAGHFQIRKIEDFSAFVEHFEFFLSVAIVGKGIDLGNDVEGDLTRIDLLYDRLARGDGVDLLLEFGNALCAAAGNGLVGRGDDRFQAEGTVQGRERHEGNDGGAVRIRDDAVRMILGGEGIDFGDDKRYASIHAEGGGVIDHHTTCGCGGRAEFFRDGATSAEESDVDACEAVMRKFLHGDLLTAEGERFSDGACGGEQGELFHGKVAFF